VQWHPEHLPCVRFEDLTEVSSFQYSGIWRRVVSFRHNGVSFVSHCRNLNTDSFDLRNNFAFMGRGHMKSVCIC
jgi:hypothetical protein